VLASFLNSMLIAALEHSFFLSSMNPRAALHFRVVLSMAFSLAGCTPQHTEQTTSFVPERDLIVIVGKRLSITEQRTEPDVMDRKFEARYRILQLVFGKYEESEITFTAYDHYGYPKFAHYDTALLFVSRYQGTLYHEKYQFFDVYPTKDGRWATCGDPHKYEPEMHRGKLEPVEIQFAEDVSNETAGGQCNKGNYVEDLFQVKKDGVLKARGLFK
jgi:hypothetical protein